MNTYIVKDGQNLIDVSVQLYGSVEGLFDLLISNDWLTYDTQLKSGDELKYHEFFLLDPEVKSSIDSNGIVVANGHPSSLPVCTVNTCLAIIVAKPSGDNNAVSLSIKGTGSINIDWGDSIDTVYIDGSYYTDTKHLYSSSEEVKIIIFGSGEVSGLSVAGQQSMVYLMRATNSIKEFIQAEPSLGETMIFNPWNAGLKTLVYQNQKNFDFGGIKRFDLNYLDLSGTSFTKSSLDSYLIWLKNNISRLEGCSIVIDESALDDSHYDLIDEIVNNEKYNDKFVFFIGDLVIAGTGFEYSVDFVLD